MIGPNMTPLGIWLTILGMALVTFGTRASALLLIGEGELPLNVRRALRYVPPAVLTAIIFPALLAPDGPLDISLGNARLLAGIAAGLIAWRARSTLLAIGAGMLLLWGLRWLLGS